MRHAPRTKTSLSPGRSTAATRQLTHHWYRAATMRVIGPRSNMARGRPLLFADGTATIRSNGRGRRPAAVQDFTSRRVEPHCQVELPFGRGQPIRLFVCAGRLVLDVEIQG